MEPHILILDVRKEPSCEQHDDQHGILPLANLLCHEETDRDQQDQMRKERVGRTEENCDEPES